MKSCKNQNKTSNEEEKAKEVTKERGEAELTLEPAQTDTRHKRTTFPPKEGFSPPRVFERREPTDLGNVGGRRDHRRPSALRKEKEGQQMFRGPLGTGRIDEGIHYGTSGNLKGTYVNMLRESSRSTPAGVKELARRTGPAPGASAMMEGRIAALEAENEALRKEVVRLASRL